MRGGPAFRLNRRAFLKLSSTLAAAGYLPALPRPPAILATLPLPVPHTYLADPDRLLADPAAQNADLWLVPAYAAAALIAQEALLDLSPAGWRAAGRAHDPEGSFTVPYAQALGMLLASGPAPRSLEEAWQTGTLWPAAPRLTLGAALMRRGYSPNDTHPGHLAQIEQDLLAARPRLAAEPSAALHQQKDRTAFALRLAAAPLAAGLQAALPAEGTLAIDFDWVIPRRAARPDAALAFLRQVAAAPQPAAPISGRRTTLAPLPAAAQAQRAALWARLTR